MATTEEQIEMLASERAVRNGAPCTVVVEDKVYNVKDVPNIIKRKIYDLELEALILEREAKSETTLKRAQKIAKKLRTLHSKTAAYYILGLKALFVPFLFAIYWRILDCRTSEHTFKINQAGMQGESVNFFYANWQITKAQLALSTKLVGDGIKQYQERMESAESMLEADALPKKAEDDKSAASLKARRTTKR